jgi:hypothetical protein
MQEEGPRKKKVKRQAKGKAAAGSEEGEGAGRAALQLTALKKLELSKKGLPAWQAPDSAWENASLMRAVPTANNVADAMATLLAQAKRNLNRTYADMLQS